MALTFQYGGVLRSLPRVGYLKSIDIWMFTASFFVFFSLIELAIVGYLEQERRNSSRKDRKSETDGCPSPSSIQENITHYGTFFQNGQARESTFHDADRRVIEEMEKIPDCRIQNGIKKNLSFRAKFLVKKVKNKWRNPEQWDETARKVFPLGFAIFNVIYWSYYLGYHKIYKSLY
uniref:Neurotransmitter-gated ion-channel transmembrane domain-containing protein n=1 Tax=Acrobeloides nanus TaxID=290746 RepID=A0A914C165_9BILA